MTTSAAARMVALVALRDAALAVSRAYHDLLACHDDDALIASRASNLTAAINIAIAASQREAP